MASDPMADEKDGILKRVETSILYFGTSRNSLSGDRALEPSDLAREGVRSLGR